jgi:hypothetical protein
VFSNTRLWTQPHVAELVKHYVGNLMEGSEDTFLGKLRKQLTPTSPGAKQRFRLPTTSPLEGCDPTS